MVPSSCRAAFLASILDRLHAAALFARVSVGRLRPTRPSDGSRRLGTPGVSHAELRTLSFAHAPLMRGTLPMSTPIGTAEIQQG